MDSLSRLVTQHGRIALVLVAILSGLLAIGYLRVAWTNDPEVITLEGSDELENYRDFVQRWGSDDLIILGYEVDDAFAPAELARLRDLTDALLELPEVRWVSSLDTVSTVDVGPFGPFSRPLVPDDLDDAEDLRTRALESPFVRDSLVSGDGRMLLLAVQLAGNELDNSDTEQKALAGIDEILARSEFAELAPLAAGSPVFNRELAVLNQRDNAIFTPLALLIVTLGTGLLFRRPLPSFLSLLVIGATVLWTQGLMGWLGVPMNITTSLLPPLLMVIAAADAIHVLDCYIHRLSDGDSREDAIAWTLREIGPSCVWTSVTTAVGFASLGLVKISSVQTFGLFAVLGVTCALFHALVTLPALMCRMPLEAAATLRTDWAWLGSLNGLARRPYWAASLVAVSLALAAAAIPRVEVATHDGEFFAEQHPINRAYRVLEHHMRGITPFEIELVPDSAQNLRTGASLLAVRRMQDELAKIPELSRGHSLMDLVETAYPGVDSEDPRALERALFLTQAVAPSEVERFVHDSPPRLRISTRAEGMTSARSEELIAMVRSRGQEILPAGWSARPTGLVPVFSQMEQYLVEGQLASYGVAILGITLVFLVLLRSLRLALVALLANLVPVACLAAVMGFSSIRLDVVTVMVASIAMGIIVDDTIHLCRAFQRGLALGLSESHAMRRALEIAGRAVIVSSLVLVSGFAALTLSGFKPTAHFGTLVCCAILAALVGDLVVLPAGLRLMHRTRVPGLELAAEES